MDRARQLRVAALISLLVVLAVALILILASTAYAAPAAVGDGSTLRLDSRSPDYVALDEFDCFVVDKYCVEYFPNKTLTTSSTTYGAVESTIDHDWGTGGPGQGIPNDGFSARWYGMHTFAAGDYVFVARADDGIRLWVDNVLLIDQWHDQAVTEYTAVKTMTAGEHLIGVEYYENTGLAAVQVRWQPGSDPCFEIPVGQFCAEYFANTTLAGAPAVRVLEAAAPRYDWGSAGPGHGLPADGFSARWTGTLHATQGTYEDTPYDRTYTFVVAADDGVRLKVDGTTKIDHWVEQAATKYQADLTLPEGDHKVEMEYYEKAGLAAAKLGIYENDRGTFRAEYYDNTTLSGLPTSVRLEESFLYDNWESGGPGDGVRSDNFSARYTGTFSFPSDGTYGFFALADDGVKVWIDGSLVIDRWIDQAPTPYLVDVPLKAGFHEVRLDYYEHTGGALVSLEWWLAADCPVGQMRADYYGLGEGAGGVGPSWFFWCEDVPIDHDWGFGGLGEGAMGAKLLDNFRARYTGTFSFPSDGNYIFTATADDGIRVYVDDDLVISGWKDQAATTYVGSKALKAGEHKVRAEYYEHTGLAVTKLSWSQGCPDGQLHADYYANTTLSGAPALSRCENAPIDARWGEYGPGGVLGGDNFSARWIGTFTFDAGTYYFAATADDGVRLWVDGVPVVDKWLVQAETTYQAARVMTAGRHTIRMEYYEHTGDAVARLVWNQGCPYGQFLAEYYNNATLSGTPVFTRCENPANKETWWGWSIDKSWGTGGPGNGLGVDNFSVRWTTTYNFDGLTWDFYARSDDGVRIWVGDELLIDGWRDQPPTGYVNQLWVNEETGSGWLVVRIEYYEHTGGASIQAGWRMVAG